MTGQFDERIMDKLDEWDRALVRDRLQAAYNEGYSVCKADIERLRALNVELDKKAQHYHTRITRMQEALQIIYDDHSLPLELVEIAHHALEI